jgi:hypothetical protein
MMPRKLPSDDILVYLLTQGYRLTEIARLYHVDRTSVRDHAHRLGFFGKPGGPTRSMKDRSLPAHLAA